MSTHSQQDNRVSRKQPTPERNAKARRKGGPRSRSGCTTCKIRHVKCDETKPSCRQCIDTGRKCDGYNALRTNPQKNSASSQLSITSYAIPFQVPGSQKERRLIHYFCVKGAADLSGYLTSEFWTRVVLQRTHGQLAVRQAVVALSSLHLDYTTTDNASRGSNTVGEESILLYNKALRSLRKYLNNGIDKEEQLSPAIPLICCALFYCFESARGNVDAAMQHLRSGVVMLNKEKDKGKLTHASSRGESNAADDMDMLEQVFYRLDLQATMFDDVRLPLLPSGPLDIPSGTSHSSTGSFTSIGEAQVALVKLQNWFLRFLISNEEYKFWTEEKLPSYVVQEKIRFVEAYAWWGQEFDILDQKLQLQQLQEQHRPSNQSPATPAWRTADGFRPMASETIQNPEIAVLRIHYLIFHLLLESSLPYDPTVFNTAHISEHRGTIDTILELAESTLTLKAHDSVPGINCGILSAETGIIAPLFLLAMKSGDTGVVRRALSLLAASNRREGLYDARVVVGIAERIMSQASERAAEGAPRDSDDSVVSPLEYRGGDAINERVGGVDGIAKNLGVNIA